MKQIEELTPEDIADALADWDAIVASMPLPKPKPKVVVSDGEVVRDVEVRVSADDDNARRRGSEIVSVQRPDPEWLGAAAGLRPGTVRVNLELADRQRAEREWEEARTQQFRSGLREADPMGIWSQDGDR